MKPIILTDCSKINDQNNEEKLNRIFENDENKSSIQEIEGGKDFPDKLCTRNLGIFKKSSKNGKEYWTSRLIGVVHFRDAQNDIIESEEYLCIKPRWGEVVPMLSEILKSDESLEEEVANYLKPQKRKCDEWEKEDLSARKSNFLYGIVTDEPEILINNMENRDKTDESDAPRVVSEIANFFEVYEYIQQLLVICKRVLKQQSIPYEENLSCKVKGKILINKQIKYNLSRGRIDRNYCQFNKMSIDNIENRILKYALYLCEKWSKDNHNFMSEDIRFCHNILKAVKLVKITCADIRSVKVNKAYKDYQRGIESAKNIISRMTFHFSGNGSASVTANKVRPFFFRMDLLFELYCRVLIREALKGTHFRMEDYSQNKYYLFSDESESKEWNKPDGFQECNIPDILIKKDNSGKSGKAEYIIDAKYSFLNDSCKMRERSNTHQLLAYMFLSQADSGGFIYPKKGNGCEFKKMPLSAPNQSKILFSIGLGEINNSSVEELNKFFMELDSQLLGLEKQKKEGKGK